MGERASSTGAEYEPADIDRPAYICLFPVVLLDEREARNALVHEMIHHWEHTTKKENCNLSYPRHIDETIQGRFSDTTRERRWRAGHSDKFISKAYKVAKFLHISIRDLLFKC